MKRILLTTYQNTDSVYRDVAQGNLDVGYNGPADWAPRAKKNPALRLVSAPRGGYWEIAFNSCPADRVAGLQRTGEGRQDQGRAGPGDPQGARLRHRPREVHPADLQGPGLDGLRPASRRASSCTTRISRRIRSTPTASTRRRRRRSSRRAAGTARRRRAPRTASRPSSSSRRSPTARRIQQMAQRAAADARKIGIVIDTGVPLRGRAQQPHLRERQDEGHVRRRTTTPSSGTGTSAGSRRRRSSRCCARSTRRATRSTTRRPTTPPCCAPRWPRRSRARSPRCARPPRSSSGDLPYLPLVHLNAIDVIRKDTWHGWVGVTGRRWRAALPDLDAVPRPAAGPRPRRRAQAAGRRGGRRRATPAGSRRPARC